MTSLNHSKWVLSLSLRKDHRYHEEFVRWALGVLRGPLGLASFYSSLLWQLFFVFIHQGKRFLTVSFCVGTVWCYIHIYRDQFSGIGSKNYPVMRKKQVESVGFSSRFMSNCWALSDEICFNDTPEILALSAVIQLYRSLALKTSK